MRYTREDGCRAWLTHGLMSADIVSGLMQEYGSAEAIYDRFCAQGPGFLKGRVSGNSLAHLKEQSGKAAMHEMLVTMQKLNIGILAPKDPQYPDSLRHIPSPPALLYYRGDPDCLMGKCLAVVGSRHASPESVDTTFRICRELSQAGVTVVSGLAMGIDSAAHEGCIAGGSPTAAVLGTGIDVDYPIENVALKERIVQGGGVLLSEYPPGKRASRFVFPIRNRIVAGLGKATLLMESRIRSGSMLTVQHALEQGRDVYAFPGIPGTEWAEGAHQLLREGALYFTAASDILEDMSWEDSASRPTVQEKKELPPMTEEQRQIYVLLGRGEMSFDQLAAETGQSAPSLTVALTMLQMMGVIRPMPGKTYRRN